MFAKKDKKDMCTTWIQWEYVVETKLVRLMFAMQRKSSKSIGKASSTLEQQKVKTEKSNNIYKI